MTLALTLEELECVVATAAGHRGSWRLASKRRYSPTLKDLRRFVNPNGHAIVASCRVSDGSTPPQHWVHDLSQVAAAGSEKSATSSILSRLSRDLPWNRCTRRATGPPTLRSKRETTSSSRFRSRMALSQDHVCGRRIAAAAEGAFRGVRRSRTAVLDDLRNPELFGEGRRRSDENGRRTKATCRRSEAFIEGAARGEQPVPLAEMGPSASRRSRLSSRFGSVVLSP
jgi:hypothetical protein